MFTRFRWLGGGISTLAAACRRDILLKRTIRYTIPIIIIIWELVDPNIQVATVPLNMLRWIIEGTIGKGNYYYPVMMQMVFIFPVIWTPIERNKEKGLAYCFIANAIYELLAWAYLMNTECYRLLAFRYVFLVAAGVYAFKEYKLNLVFSIAITAIGALFISSITYWEYVPNIVNAPWASTNFISSMLIVPLMIWALQNVSVRFLPLEIIGKASYHIFLVQMVYYLGYYSRLQNRIATWQGHLLIGVIICLCIGVAFYYVEKPLQEWIGRMIPKDE